MLKEAGFRQRLCPPESHTAVDFMRVWGSVPSLERGEQPWKYRGWLLFYVQQLHAHPKFPFPDRWGYLHSLVTGYDPGPIPKISFTNKSKEAMANIHECVNIASNSVSSGWGWGGLRLYLEFVAYGLGVFMPFDENHPGLESFKLPKMDDSIGEALYRKINFEEFLRHPYDYFGAYMCEVRGKGWNPNNFYPTPHPVVECMALMAFHDVDKEEGDTRYKSFHDPCVGTGRMLLHASNYSLVLSGQDIDGIVLLATQINACLYAPWVVCPVPTQTNPEFQGIRIIRKPVDN